MIEKKIFRMQELTKIIGLSKASIYRLIKTNKFPAPIQISSRCVGFVSDDIYKWIDERQYCN